MAVLIAGLVLALCLAWGLGSLLGSIPRIYRHRETYIVGVLLCMPCVIGCFEMARAAAKEPSFAAYDYWLYAILWSLALFSLASAMRYGRRRAAHAA